MTTIINVKIMRLAHLLFFSGMVAGLIMASPSLATIVLNGIRSGTTKAVMGIIRDVSYVGLVKKMKQKAIAVKVFEKSPAP